MTTNRNTLTLLVATCCLLVLACGNVADCDCAGANSASTEAHQLPYAVRSPRGDEIEVSVKMIKPRRARATVKNVSQEPVFIPYMPMKRNGQAFFAILGLEMKDPKTGEFKSAESTDFSPGLHALRPGESFQWDFHFASSDRGDYRLDVRYSIDERDVELRKSFHTLEGEERDRVFKILDETMELSFTSCISETFKL